MLQPFPWLITLCKHAIRVGHRDGVDAENNEVWINVDLVVTARKLVCCSRERWRNCEVSDKVDDDSDQRHGNNCGNGENNPLQYGPNAKGSVAGRPRKASSKPTTTS